MNPFKFFALGILVFLGGTGIENCLATECPNLDLSNADDLPQDQFVSKLTNPCRYDKYVRPNTSTPLNISVKIDVTHLEASQTQFTSYLTIALTYRDINLNFEDFSPKRTIIFGDESLKANIWTPNLQMKDLNDTTVISSDIKDVHISIEKTGLVVYTFKMLAKFNCWMDLQKFPFDHQKCNLAFTVWSDNATNLQLVWNTASPSVFSSNLHFTEYLMDEVEYAVGTNEGPYQSTEVSPNVGSFSQVVMNFKFHRDIGYYILDFYIPSYLLVCTAWVTFWLQADAGPPRATLGASTVVAFITLHLGVAKDVPKVSYVKASDIWFLGVILFIFLSLAEFAFVNVIWRRKKQVQLKEENDIYILKCAVAPRKAREDLRRYESKLTLCAQSNESLNSTKAMEFLQNGNYTKKDCAEPPSNCHSVISIPDEVGQNQNEFNWTTMTPKEVAIFVDRKARIVFPIAFLIFNILYWVFVYCL